MASGPLGEGSWSPSGKRGERAPVRCMAGVCSAPDGGLQSSGKHTGIKLPPGDGSVLLPQAAKLLLVSPVFSNSGTGNSLHLFRARLNDSSLSL